MVYTFRFSENTVKKKWEQSTRLIGCTCKFNTYNESVKLCYLGGLYEVAGPIRNRGSGCMCIFLA